MKTIAEYRELVDSAIRDIQFPGGNLESLYAPIKYALSAGGKRIRPVLTLMAADAFGENGDVALQAALGIEIFHNFTLLHDDVMDNSDLRRGRATVYKKFGTNSAILSGDTMLTMANQYISKVPESILAEISDLFNDMAIKVYEGQQLDMDFEKADKIGLDEYIEMIKDKTGALLGAAVMIGALIGGATKKDAELMYEFGVMTGLAFQIQDDWLDTYGDPTSFGKAIGGDINNAKKTYLYVAALEERAENVEALKAAYAIPAGEMRVKTVTRLFDKSGISDKCKKAVGHYSSKALKALNSTSLTEEKKDTFRKLAEKLIGRKK